MKFSDLPTSPDSRMLRQFAGIWVLFFGALGIWKLYHDNRWGIPLMALALCAGIPGLIRPKLLKPVFVTWMILAFPIGWIVSHLILATVFYCVFTPLGLILKATGHDPLFRKRTDRESYWRKKRQQKDIRRYLNQF